ncbi:MAG: SusE domain-containing protein [Muribaculaceae bacterium]|nr:SusE domain-containing protein [Muribaculaceae bacterium]
MNKLSILMAAALVAVGVSSCSEDREPVYKAPTTFVLNEPAMSDQYIDLQDGNSLQLVCSQPDYGYSAVTQYSAQMSLTEDFAVAYDLDNMAPTTAVMAVKQADVAVGLMELHNIADQESFDAIYGTNPYEKVYFRAVAQLKGVENSKIVSNVVAYNHVKPYFAIKLPGFIYLVGAPEGWAGPTESNAAHYADWRLFEPANAIGSKVYSGVFDIPAGSAMFRFYTALTGWDADSYGSQVDDNPIDFEIVDGSFSTAIVKGKGAFNFPDWEGGLMTVTVDMSDENNMLLTIQAGSHAPVVNTYIYLVGSISGWQAPGTENEAHYANWRLTCSTGDDVYVGEFEVPAGHVNFRFATELTAEGWDNPYQIGAQADDADVACEFTNGNYSGPFVSGKGNWAFELADPGTMSMTVDLNAKTVSFVLK